MQLTRAALLTVIASLAAAAASAQDIYVTNYDHSSVSVFDGATLFVAGVDVPLSSSTPDDVVITPDRKYAFVSFQNGAQVTAIDIVTRAATNIGSPGDFLPVAETNLASSPTGDRVYLSYCHEHPFISVIDATTLTVDRQILLPFAGGAFEMAASPDGQFLYAGTGWPGPSAVLGCGNPVDGIYKISLAADTVTFLPMPEPVVGLALSPSGTVALTTGDISVFAVDVTSGLSTPVMCGATPCVYDNTTADVTFSADGTRAYVLDWNNTLFVVDMTTAVPQQIGDGIPIVDGSAFAASLALSDQTLYVLLDDVYPAVSEIVKFDVSGVPVQQPDMAISISGFKFDVWRPSCGTRGYDYTKSDMGKHLGHCKPANTNGKKTGHNK